MREKRFPVKRVDSSCIVPPAEISAKSISLTFSPTPPALRAPTGEEECTDFTVGVYLAGQLLTVLRCIGIYIGCLLSRCLRGFSFSIRIYTHQLKPLHEISRAGCEVGSLCINLTSFQIYEKDIRFNLCILSVKSTESDILRKFTDYICTGVCSSPIRETFHFTHTSNSPKSNLPLSRRVPLNPVTR